MTNPNPELGISDSALLQIEADALDHEARSPDIAETEAEKLRGRAQQTRTNVTFVEVRSGLTTSRPDLVLPYPENGEDLESYHDRMRLLVDEYDKEHRE